MNRRNQYQYSKRLELSAGNSIMMKCFEFCFHCAFNFNLSRCSMVGSVARFINENKSGPNNLLVQAVFTPGGRAAGAYTRPILSST